MESTERGPLASAVAMWIVAAVALLFLLRSAGQLLIPIVFAILISYVLEPLVSWLAAHHVPRLAGASILMLILAGVGGWSGAVVAGELDTRDATAALGFVNAMTDLPQATSKGGSLYIFGLP